MSVDNLYFDPHSLAGLRRESAQNDAGLREVAKQFEGLFVQMMLKSMRDATPQSGLFDNKETQLYQEMFDGQLATRMGKDGGLGIADMLVQQLQKHVQNNQQAEKISLSQLPRSPAMAAVPQVVTAPAVPAQAATRVESASVAVGVASSTPAVAASPATFVADLWPHAQATAERLQLAPEMIMAQAALETGWGKQVPQHADGRSSHNYFGIKAGANWQGETVTVETLEFVNGQFQPQRAAFRAYPSAAAALDDYAALLQKPRYAEALAAGTDKAGFAQGLQAAGYATDPQYANKLLRIADGPGLRQAMQTAAVGQDVG